MSFVRLPPPPKPLPSERESTLRQVAADGPKLPRHVAPADLNPASVKTSAVGNDIVPGTGSASNADRSAVNRMPRPEKVSPAREQATAPSSAIVSEPAAQSSPTLNRTSAIEGKPPAPSDVSATPEIEQPRPTGAQDAPMEASAKPTAPIVEAEAHPAQPALPAEPVEAALPAEPTEPVEAVLPAESAEPAQPGEHVEAAQPTEPVEAAPPAEPAQQTPSPREVRPVIHVQRPTAALAPHPRLSQPLPPREAPTVEPPAPGQLPSMRDMTLANTEKFGTTRANHVPPTDSADGPQLPGGATGAQRQTGLRAPTQPPAYVKKPVEAVEAPERLSQPLPPREAPTVEPPAPGQLPSMRDMTLANTEKFGATRANHVPPQAVAAQPAEVLEVPTTSTPEAAAAPPVLVTSPAAEATPSAPEPALPSMRDMTLANTEKFGATRANHVPPEALALAAAAAADATSPAVELDLPAGAEGLSQRAMTLANTEKFGATRANHIPPSELPLSQRLTADVQNDVWTRTRAAPPAAADASDGLLSRVSSLLRPLLHRATGTGETEATGDAASALPPPLARAELLPSQREMTLRNTERWGPKTANHVPPSALPLSQQLTADVRNDVWERVPPASSGAASAAPAPTSPATTADAQLRVSAPATAELLPSQREMTLRNTERWGPKSANHVPPPQLAATAGAVAAVAAVEGSTAETALVAPAADRGGAAARATAGAAVSRAQAATTTAASATALLSKPLREWTGDDVRTAARKVIANPFVMSAAAVGAAALTVFSIYKGAELYNRYYLAQCVAEVEREQPAAVQLFITKRSPLAPSESVPCSWVETYLRIARVPYVAHVISDPAVSPNGQLPFIVHRSTKLAGAKEIIEYVKNVFDADIDRDLTRGERATGVAMLSALEYSLTRGYMRSVYVDRPDVIRPYYSEMNATPDFLTRFALQRMASRISAKNKTSGYAYYSAEQAAEQLLNDTVAFERLLSVQNFLFSSYQPSTFDCALYAWLLPIVAMESASSVNASFRHIVRSKTLIRFVKEMTVYAFPDFEEIVRNQSYIPDAPRGGNIAGGSPTKALTYE